MQRPGIASVRSLPGELFGAGPVSELLSYAPKVPKRAGVAGVGSLPIQPDGNPVAPPELGGPAEISQIPGGAGVADGGVPEPCGRDVVAAGAAGVLVEVVGWVVAVGGADARRRSVRYQDCEGSVDAFARVLAEGA